MATKLDKPLKREIRVEGKPTQDLHGSAPDECRVALLIIGMINAFDFDGAEPMLPRL